MVYGNTASNHYLDLYLKNLPLEPFCDYELTFDSLGAPLNVWPNPKHIASREGRPVTEACDRWTPFRLRFSTGQGTGSRGHWAFSFNKQLVGFPVTGRQPTYIDNVRLVRCDAPTVNLLSGGDFEAPIHDAVYQKNWGTILFDVNSRAHGLDLVEDPLDPHNHCLMIPRIIKAPVYAEEAPLQVDSYGCYRDLPSRCSFIEPHGCSEYQLFFVTHGALEWCIDGVMQRFDEGTVLYVPPHTPTNGLLQKGEGAVYHWITFRGETAAKLLAQSGLTALCAREATTLSPLTGCINRMLTLSPDDPLYACEVTGYLQVLLSELKRLLQPHEIHTVPRVIREAAHTLRTHPEHSISNERLATQAGLSTGHFIRSFKQYIGLSPNQYRLRELMKKGENLLIRTPLTVQEVAYRLGLDDPYYFSRLFRSVYGVSPREYRKKNKK